MNGREFRVSICLIFRLRFGFVVGFFKCMWVFWVKVLCCFLRKVVFIMVLRYEVYGFESFKIDMF